MVSNFLSSIEFQMSLLLFVSLAGYLIASKINQSAVIGEIIIGLIIGPSFLGLITYTDFVASIAHIGAIILLFVVGLEFRLKDIFNLKYSAIALVGVIVPWIGGFFVAKTFGYGFGPAIFVGTALTATSIAITANVLREMGKLKTEAAKAIIGAAVIDDILGLLALSFTQEIVNRSVSFSSIIFIAAKSIGFIAIGAFFGYKFLTKFIESIDKSKIAKKFPEFVFIFAIMIAFFYSMIAETIGLSAIVGSFLAGVCLEGVVIRHGKDYREGAEYLHIIFASIFFVSLGILADFHALTANIIWFLIVLTIVAVLIKVIGCYIPSRLLRMNHKDSLAIGWGMSPRGEVAMIVALIGLNSAIIGQGIYISIVLMSLLTTILTPIILKNWIYKNSV